MIRPFRLALAAICAHVACAPAHAQQTAGPNDIVVTARRVEERLQDVPISITVFDQQQLADRNVISASDLAAYTPSLSSNANFGPDNTSFAIRGFVQDIGTAPSVGVYFGDVVTARGASNGQRAGDAGNAGDLWDLQNVQVLKGPQGTLQGRNTTGGAVLFVPKKPVDRFEGYVEGGYGNFNEQRLQAVLNLPLSDTFLVRIGGDHVKRGGYLDNVVDYGPRHFGDVDTWSARLSIVANLAPGLENYTIVSYNSSSNNGSVSKLVAAEPTGLFGRFAAAQLAQQAGNFYNVENAAADAHLLTRQWQVINTTTWTASKALTVKNIASYAELRQQGLNPIFGIRFQVPVSGALYNTGFQVSNSPAGGYTASESTFTEELRLNGSIGGDRLTWQAGAYLEVSNPISHLSGSQSPGFASCAGHDFSTAQCSDPFFGLVTANLPAGFVPFLIGRHILPDGIGNINYTAGQTAFRHVGLYGQVTYALADRLRLTGGFRYTWDYETIDTVQRVYNLQIPPGLGTRSPFGTARAYYCLQVIAAYPDCQAHFQTASHKPTWLIDTDYNPARDILLYAKWARGYRQSVIVPVIPVGGTAAMPDTTFNYPRPETVDAYEIGAKTGWRGTIAGSFNAALFYNTLRNQQIQVGFIPQPTATVSQTAAPVNAGKSTIYGAEIEASLSPVRGLALTVGYTYLHTRIDEVLPVPLSPLYITQPAFNVGDPEALSPKSKVTAGANYMLPLDPKIGTLTIGGSVTYRTSMLTNYTDRNNTLSPSLQPFSYLPALTLFNANVVWNSFASLPIDLNAFVSNLMNKKYYTFTPGLGSRSLNFEVANVGEPRMFGFTAKYRF